MKKQLLFIALLFGSFCAIAQNFRAYDNCASINLYDTTARKFYTFPKSQLNVYKSPSSLQLLKINSPIVIATWDISNIALIAPDLDAGNALLSSWLNTTCVTVFDGAQCLELNEDTLSITGCAGEVILPPAPQYPFDTISGDWGDISYTKLYNPINAPDTTEKRHIGLFYYRGGESPFGLVYGFAMDVENGMSVVGIGNDSINDFEFEAATGKFKITGIPQGSLNYVYGVGADGLMFKDTLPKVVVLDTIIILGDTLALQNSDVVPITLIPAQGEGTAIHVQSVSVMAYYGETYYDNSSNGFELSVNGNLYGRFKPVASTDKFFGLNLGSTSGDMVNYPFVLKTSEPTTTGDTTFKLHIYYTIETF